MLIVRNSWCSWFIEVLPSLASIFPRPYPRVQVISALLFLRTAAIWITDNSNDLMST